MHFKVNIMYQHCFVCCNKHIILIEEVNNRGKYMRGIKGFFYMIFPIFLLKNKVDFEGKKEK